MGVKVARAFYLASLALVAACAIWASVNAIFFDARSGMTFLVAGEVSLFGGLPLLLAGALLHSVRKRRSSMTMPSWWADWKRDRGNPPY